MENCSEFRPVAKDPGQRQNTEDVYCSFRESSFNMTSGGDEEIEGELWKFLDTRKGALKKLREGGGAPKICILNNQQEGGGS